MKTKTSRAAADPAAPVAAAAGTVEVPINVAQVGAGGRVALMPGVSARAIVLDACNQSVPAGSDGQLWMRIAAGDCPPVTAKTAFLITSPATVETR
jgi:hypothetical protein